MKIGIYSNDHKAGNSSYTIHGSAIEQEKSSIGLQAAILAILLVVLAVFILYHEVFPTPGQQVRKTINALGSRKWLTIKPYLTMATIHEVTRACGGERLLENQASCKAIDPINSFLASGHMHIKKIRCIDNEKILVELEPAVKFDRKSGGRNRIFLCVLVRQNDRLKLDMPQTRLNMLKARTKNPISTDRKP